MPAVVVTILVLMILKHFCRIILIGQPRKPIQPGDVVVSLGIDGLLILWMVRTFLYPR